MSILTRVLVILIICLIAMALPAAPVQAQCTGPIIELSPSSGVPGIDVIVKGQGFDADKYVDISYDGAIIATGRTDSSGDFTILFTVPKGYKGAYEVYAIVGSHTGYDTINAHFTVKPGLTISPEKGPVGTMVIVRGQGFAKKEEGIELMYYLNDSYEMIQRRITADAQGSWELSFPIPLSTRGEHKIDAEGDESQLYEVQDATFKITPEISIDKSSGNVGESITMTGSRFTAYEKSIQILFDGRAVVTDTDIKANAEGDWEASFEVPEMPVGMYGVTADGEWTKNEDIGELSFEIKPDIVLSITEGHVGIALTATGRGFAASEEVVIMYEDNQVATARSNVQGSFEVSFLVPESQYTSHQVIARDASGNSAAAILAMESDPPDKPKLMSPSNRAWVGLIGKVTPTFEWSAVSDDSGVSYSLQIATTDNVTTAGEFVHPIVSVTDLTEARYKLTEALSYGAYYWIVQAVDGADNKSGWTIAHSFRAGLLPTWGFIAAIVAIVVLFGALIRFLVRRRRYYYE